MSFVWRWLKRAFLALIIVVAALLMPIAYVEVACRPIGQPLAYQAILPPEDHRPESRTLLTYPEWHIVHAYEDYGRVIDTGDPHSYRFLSGISGFWGSLCALSKASGQLGEVDTATKQMVYVIGVSFTAELMLKAAYEETFGRIFATVRGSDRAPLDDLSAGQAKDYAKFLQQTPWYRWDFEGDAAALADAATTALRDRERNFALGLEYQAKAAYAKAIAAAIEQTGPDDLKLHMIITGLPEAMLNQIEGVEVIAVRDAGIEIKTVRYRELTLLIQSLANRGVDFVEIAGNDQIMLTVISSIASHPEAMYSRARQGSDDYRHLVLNDVAQLGNTLRALRDGSARLEHIHDY
ncbi:MAG: hypothetical protein AAGK37_07530 [Pseudomonadota bacterium]